MQMLPKTHAELIYSIFDPFEVSFMNTYCNVRVGNVLCGHIYGYLFCYRPHYSLGTSNDFK
jgi:hypothetical protein